LAVTKSLVIPRAVVEQIEREGVTAYPNECCGLLVGTIEPRLVERIVPMPNAFDPVERYHRFSIDPLTMARVEEEAANAGKAVIGFFHSHPDHPARPSEYDRMHVPPWNFYSHVIVAIEKAKPAAMTAWVFNEETEQFDEQRIVHDETRRP
jgi:proteasome lid subunit RPN8/RPN11